MKLNNYFDKIICINLDRRPDRWREAQEQFKKAGITVERFSAVDGNPRGWAHVNDAIEGKSINDIKNMFMCNLKKVFKFSLWPVIKIIF